MIKDPQMPINLFDIMFNKTVQALKEEDETFIQIYAQASTKYKLRVITISHTDPIEYMKALEESAALMDSIVSDNAVSQWKISIYRDIASLSLNHNSEFFDVEKGAAYIAKFHEEFRKLTGDIRRSNQIAMVI